jgi:hypothetical protein
MTGLSTAVIAHHDIGFEIPHQEIGQQSLA